MHIYIYLYIYFTKLKNIINKILICLRLHFLIYYRLNPHSAKNIEVLKQILVFIL